MFHASFGVSWLITKSFLHTNPPSEKPNQNRSSAERPSSTVKLLKRFKSRYARMDGCSEFFRNEPKSTVFSWLVVKLKRQFAGRRRNAPIRSARLSASAFSLFERDHISSPRKGVIFGTCASAASNFFLLPAGALIQVRLREPTGNFFGHCALTNWSNDTPSLAASSPAFFLIESGSLTFVAVIFSSPIFAEIPPGSIRRCQIVPRLQNRGCYASQ